MSLKGITGDDDDDDDDLFQFTIFSVDSTTYNNLRKISLENTELGMINSCT